MALLDEQDQVVYRKRLPNDAAVILEALGRYRTGIEGLVVESSYNLVLAGRRAQGGRRPGPPGQHRRHRAVRRAKYSDVNSDTQWLTPNVVRIHR